VTLQSALSVTGVTTVQAGTAAAPAITTIGDTNTGIFFPAADTIAFSEGGTEAMRIDSSGNVGVGTTPSAWGSTAKAVQLPSGCAIARIGDGDFVVTQNAYFDNPNFKYASTTGVGSSVYRQIDGTHRWLYAASGTAGNNITFTEAMRIDSSGNVGIGTSSPSAKFQVAGDVRINTVGTATTGLPIYAKQTNNDQRGIWTESATTDSNGRFYCDNSVVGIAAAYSTTGSYLPITFTTSATERMRIDSSGSLLVGKTAAGAVNVGFEVLNTGSIYSSVASSTNSENTYIVYSTTASAFRFYVGMGGTISATSTTITGISDVRLKENIRDLDDGLEKVMALQPRKFDWKEGKGADIKNARGFIAQEFETVFPDMIEEWKDPAPEGEEPYKAVNANLIPTLVKAIQEQQALITTLTDRITALEAK
jgi:hypothetical protein